MTESELKALEKEMRGLKAKLNWDHITNSQRQAYEERIAYIEAIMRKQTEPVK